MIQHALGETCVPAQSQRVIALSVPTLGDALALGVKPIASIVYFDNPPPYLAKHLESIEILGKEEQPNIEKILALKPDLIVGIKYSTEAIYNQLSQIAPTVVDDWEGYPSWRDHFNFVAEVLGKTEEAKQVWANYHQRIDSLKTALGDRLQDLEISFVHICCGTIDIDLKNSFNGSILAELGVRRPPAQAVSIAGGITSLSEERLMDIDGNAHPALKRQGIRRASLVMVCFSSPLPQRCCRCSPTSILVQEPPGRLISPTLPHKRSESLAGVPPVVRPRVYESLCPPVGVLFIHRFNHRTTPLDFGLRVMHQHLPTGKAVSAKSDSALAAFRYV